MDNNIRTNKKNRGIFDGKMSGRTQETDSNPNRVELQGGSKFNWKVVYEEHKLWFRIFGGLSTAIIFCVSYAIHIYYKQDAIYDDVKEIKEKVVSIEASTNKLSKKSLAQCYQIKYLGKFVKSLKEDDLKCEDGNN